MQYQRAAIEQQRLDTVATEKRVEELYSEIQQLRGITIFFFQRAGIKQANLSLAWLKIISLAVYFTQNTVTTQG